MGTNYYWERAAKDPCPTCGHRADSDDRLHIGKSSVGWVFSLHIIPEESINNLNDWIVLWQTEKGQIRDEYGEYVPLMEMLEVILLRTHPTGLRGHGGGIVTDGSTFELATGEFC